MLPDEPTQVVGHEGGQREQPGRPRVGAPWGKWLIEKRLGGGGQAEVFQAFDQHGTAGHVALKVPTRPLGEEQLQQWVDAEAGSLTRLEHPNVVRILDAGRVGAYPYVATELVEGLPLNECVRREAPDARHALEWIASLAEAIDGAHRRGITHRDVKPANVILTEGGEPKLIDFGLAGLVTAYSAESRSDVSGTLPFMAPEQARGDPRADHRVDVFGLGALLKYLLTGEGPYHGAANAMRAARNGEVRMVEPGGSPLRRSLCAVANRAMAPEPDERFQNAGEMARALRSIRARRIAFLGALAAGVLVAAVGLWLLLRSPTPAPLTATMEVRLRPSGQQSSYQELTADASPLAPGDGVQLRARFSRPVFAYVIAAAREQRPRLLHPEPSQVSDRVSEIVFPGEGGYYEPPRTGRTWTLVVAAADRPKQDLEAALRELGQAPEIGGPGLLTLTDGDLRFDVSTRSRIARRDVPVNEGFLAGLAGGSVQEWGTVRAVAFPYWDADQRQTRLDALMARIGERRPREVVHATAPATYRYEISEHSATIMTHLQIAAGGRMSMHQDRESLQVFPSPDGYVEVGVRRDGHMMSRASALSAVIRGLEVDTAPGDYHSAVLVVHSYAPDDSEQGTTPYRVVFNRRIIGEGLTARRGEQKSEEFPFDADLVRTGAQEIMLHYDPKPGQRTSGRIDWIELKLLPGEPHP